MSDKKVIELGTVTEVYISGMCNLDSGNRIAAKQGGVTLKKGDFIVKEDGVIKVGVKPAAPKKTGTKKAPAKKVETEGTEDLETGTTPNVGTETSETEETK